MDLANTLQRINFEESLKTSANDSDNRITIYKDSKLGLNTVVKLTEYLLTAFPKSERKYIDLLFERMQANNFTNKRATDAVNYVIDNYTGYDKIPAIADFIKYDKKIKYYKPSEIKGDMLQELGVTLFAVGVDGQLCWTEEANLKYFDRWNNENNKSK